mmetsp:Transcript_84497/g.159176  ORF Transcript_84497/g.159176 Transcript_84497/m.159176 type:complete len:211 (+) Transcript_84497:591-1223(+)
MKVTQAVAVLMPMAVPMSMTVSMPISVTLHAIVSVTMLAALCWRRLEGCLLFLLYLLAECSHGGNHLVAASHRSEAHHFQTLKRKGLKVPDDGRRPFDLCDYASRLKMHCELLQILLTRSQRRKALDELFHKPLQDVELSGEEKLRCLENLQPTNHMTTGAIATEANNFVGVTHLFFVQFGSCLCLCSLSSDDLLFSLLGLRRGVRLSFA